MITHLGYFMDATLLVEGIFFKLLLIGSHNVGLLQNHTMFVFGQSSGRIYVFKYLLLHQVVVFQEFMFVPMVLDVVY